MSTLPTSELPSDGGQDLQRNLLFGLLAWQLGFVSREKLVAGFSAWLRDRSKSLEGLLLEQQTISVDQKDLLLGLMAKHLELHGNSVANSLQALSSIGSVAEELAQLSGGALQATLEFVGRSKEDSGSLETITLPPGGQASGAASGKGGRPRYRIVRSHAKGGLGEVFIAFDAELNREVAVKEIQKRFADHGESRSRFRQEAEITGKLEHPGIVPVYGLGQYQDGRPFYAMRFIRGDSLQQAIEAFHQRFPTGKTKQNAATDEALELRKLLRRFIDVCNAMEYAHSRGVLHRDLKPGNIILGKYGETLVVDWGLAKLLGQAEGNALTSEPLRLSDDSGSSPTVVGAAVGTPAFMSPEQAMGAVDRLGPATDIYSLGATLYHLLAGRPPLKENTVAETIAKVREGKFDSPRTHRPEVPRALEAICLKAMALEPKDRYASPMELSEDLERWMGDEPIRAKRDSWQEAATRLIRRNRAWALSGVLAIFVVAVVATVSAFVVDGERQKAVNAKLAEGTERKKAVDATQKAQDAEREERHQRSLADQRTAEAQRNSYIANIRLANAAWQAGDVRAMEEALEQCLPVGDGPDLRGWEWNYFQNLRVGSLLTMTNKSSSGYSVDMQADGRRMVMGTMTGAEILDVVTGKVIRTIVAHEAKDFSQVAISPDGKWVATNVGQQPLRIWELESGKLMHEFVLDEQGASQLRFSPDNKLIAVGGFNHVINLWNVETGKRALQLNGHEGIIRGLAFNPAGNRLASGDDANSAKVWDLDEGRELHSFRSSGPNIVAGVRATFFGVCFSPDGNRLATACSNRWIEVFDMTSPRTLMAWTGHSDQITGVVYLPQRETGDHLVTCSLDQMLCEWSERDGTLQRTFRGHSAGVFSMATSKDGRRIASVSLDKMTKVWDSATEVDAYECPAYGILNAMDVSSDSGRVAVAGNGTYLLVLSTFSRAGLQMLVPLKQTWGILYDLKFSQDGKRILSFGSDHPATVWDLEAGKLLRRFDQIDRLGGTDLSPDGQHVALQANQSAGIFRVETGEQVVALEGDDFIARMSYSPDGKTLVGVMKEGIGLWDTETGKQRKVISHLESQFTTMATHYGTNRMACAYASGMIYLLDMNDGSIIATSSGHLKTIMSLSFNPQGNRLVSGSRDQLIKIWDVPSGQLLCTLRGHKADVTQVKFASDGKRMISMGWDSKVKIWNGDQESSNAQRRLEEVACTSLQYWRQRTPNPVELPIRIDQDVLLGEESRQIAKRILQEYPLRRYEFDLQKN